MRDRLPGRLLNVLSGLFILVLFAAQLGGEPAGAAGLLDLMCTGTESATYSPGLTLSTQSVTVTASHTYTSCSGSDPSVTSGSDGRMLRNNISCLTLADGGAGTLSLAWNNGRTSMFNFNRLVTHPVGETVVAYVGSITSGEFAGDNAVLTVTSATLDAAACIAPPGVPGSSGLAVLVVTGLLGSTPSPTPSVPAPAPTPPLGRALPVTGSNVALVPMVMFAAMLLASGAALLLRGRRQRRPGNP